MIGRIKEICFDMWYYIIAYPQYYVSAFIRRRVKYALNNGMSSREIALYINMMISLSIGLISRKIYDIYYNDWTSYMVLLVVVFILGSNLGRWFYPKLALYVVDSCSMIRNEDYAEENIMPMMSRQNN